MFKRNKRMRRNFIGQLQMALNESDFDAKPMVLLIGQYSTGGKQVLFDIFWRERDPGLRIGPEPTTDCFNVVMYGEQEQVIPGNALAVDNKKQFRPLSKFGGEKQRVDRGYDFVGVLKWFSERVDRIILLFDANKLDISDEFQRSIQAVHGYEDKVRIVLNKADQVDQQELLRVYGALMWSISKVLSVPECPKVFVGSFWDQQLKHDHYRRLFEQELQSLFDDLQTLPRSLRKEMPKFCGKGRKKKDLLKRLPELLERVQREHMVSATDVPPPEKLVATVDEMLDKDIAELMTIVPADANEPLITGGAFNDVKDVNSPFGYKKILPNPVLAKIWRLADVDQDGALDSDEFALAMHLIHVKLDGFDLTDDLPEHLIPPSKKKYLETDVTAILRLLQTCTKSVVASLFNDLKSNKLKSSLFLIVQTHILIMEKS
ncbi:EHD1 [Lepeophtheirus salmonis]|uniref:EHD1 n=1 Tax=Lepeophtheirus salmonis TaxID=72036 RepID=A0A7R8D143_LEPSM|nr:EHD1 [Lepeophtheirus salmonis]CAF2986293.1 EHD1 [Lepeophtheirus salmonis]